MPAVTREIEIQLNGEKFLVAARATVADLVRQLELTEDRVAVELDRRIVRRADWGGETLCAGSAIEIVQIVGGG
jgi:thiamine biosynthesis protein ThiS